MDLGTTHSILLNDDEAESRVTADNRRVHPVAHAPGGKLLWQILETEGSCNIDKITADSLQVKLKVYNVLRSDYDLYTFQPIKYNTNNLSFVLIVLLVSNVASICTFI